MEHWRVRENRKINQLKDYASALESREKLLIDALAELAQGYGIDTGKSWDKAMQKLAGNTLAKVAGMRIPSRPCL